MTHYIFWSSLPWALAGSKVFIVNDRSSSIKWNNVLYENNGDMLKILLVYILMQKSYWKDLLFSQKSEANFPLTSKGGVAEIFT